MKQCNHLKIVCWLTASLVCLHAFEVCLHMSGTYTPGQKLGHGNDLLHMLWLLLKQTEMKWVMVLHHIVGVVSVWFIGKWLSSYVFLKKNSDIWIRNGSIYLFQYLFIPIISLSSKFGPGMLPWSVAQKADLGKHCNNRSRWQKAESNYSTQIIQNISQY